MHELPIKIHDILDNDLSRKVGNTAHILAHVFASTSRQCNEVLASQFPFLHSLKDIVPSSEACLYGCINLSMTQA